MPRKPAYLGDEENAYWLDLFSRQTWKEFQDHGGNIAGFREGRWAAVSRMKSGDRLLCYLTRASRWIGLLEVVGEPFIDEEPIWSSQVFPSRVPVKVVMALAPQDGVPVISMKEQLTLFKGAHDPNHWSGPFRQSARRLSTADGKAIVRALRDAQSKALERGIGASRPPSRMNRP